MSKQIKDGISPMKIIKRSGSEAVFDISKIISAIGRANVVVQDSLRLQKDQILDIASGKGIKTIVGKNKGKISKLPAELTVWTRTDLL